MPTIAEAHSSVLSSSEFLSTVKTLWFRLTTLGIVSLAFTEALLLAPGKAQGWSFYLSVPEVFFEVFVRLIAAGLAGIALGTLATILLLPLVWWLKPSLGWLVDTATKFTVVLVVFLVSRYALHVLIKWSYGFGTHRAIYDTILMAGLYIVFAVALCLPNGRKAIATSMDGFLTESMTRRTAMTTVAGAAALVVAEFALSKSLPGREPVVAQARPKQNFLLVTFDALSAEDMSLYGRPLLTTPNIDAFARQSTVFANYFATSTFTTPTVTTMMTGTYPSETGVYHLQGRMRRADVLKSLPHVMRGAGYRTAAFLTNPFAYYVNLGMHEQYDEFPEPVFQQGGVQHLWDATTPLHQLSGVGTRLDEYYDLEYMWNYWGRMPDNLALRYRPDLAFDNAKKMLAELPDGFFCWIHVITPHDPYHPDAAERGRFLPDSKVITYEGEYGGRWRPHYPPDQQPLVDERRLRYDEFIATGDRRFGDFMDWIDKTGRLRNTTVAISADHGEGFSGGVYQHNTPYLTRPVIHVPLIIRTPGQQAGRTVSAIVDQTSLAPTLLELAGVQRPDAMKGPSLVPFFARAQQPETGGRAFCQHFERNSVFKPIRHGSVGIIEGDFQYVVYIDDQRGVLRPLAEAEVWNLDRSAEFPQQAAALRNLLHERFPDLVQKS